MWNTVSVLVRYSTGCSTFEIHIRGSSNYTQLLGIGTYGEKRHQVMLKVVKTCSDVLVNGIIFPHFQSVFYAFFNKVNRSNFITSMAPSWVDILLMQTKRATKSGGKEQLEMK